MKADQIAAITACIAIIEWIAMSEFVRVRKLYRHEPVVWIYHYLEGYWPCDCFGIFFLTLAYLFPGPETLPGFAIATATFFFVGRYGAWLDLELNS